MNDLIGGRHPSSSFSPKRKEGTVTCFTSVCLDISIEPWGSEVEGEWER